MIDDGIIITFPVKFLLDIAPDNTMKGSYFTNASGEVKSRRLRFHSKKNQVIAGYKICLREIEWVRQAPDDRWWNHSIGTKPTREVLYAYIVILGRVRYRANIVGWEAGGEKEFQDGRKRTAKHWLILGHFVPAPFAIKIKGSRGFQYTEKLF